MARQSATVGLLVAALVLTGVPALAQQGIDFSRAGRNEVYRDLPGVVTPEEAEARRNQVVCVRKHVDRPLSGRWRPGESVLYSCTSGGLTFETNQLPYSREREMRGIGW